MARRPYRERYDEEEKTVAVNSRAKIKRWAIRNVPLLRRWRGQGADKKVLLALRDKLDASYSHDTHSGRDFITRFDLLDKISEGDLDRLLGGCSWFKPDLVRTTHQYYIAVVASLIQTHWDEWETFGDVFLSDDGKFDANIGPETNLTCLGSRETSFRRLLLGHRPVVFTEGDYTQVYSETQVFPFLKRERLDRNNPRPVYLVELERYSLIRKAVIDRRGRRTTYKRREDKLNYNTNPVQCVLKEIDDEDVFERELALYSACRQNRNGQSSEIGIHFPLAIFCRRTGTKFLTGYLLSVKATGNLQRLLTDAEEFRRQLCDFTVGNMFQQLRQVAGALTLMHDKKDALLEDPDQSDPMRRSIQSRQYAHYDLKPENVLVSTGSRYGHPPIGLWQITDMGLAYAFKVSERLGQEFSSQDPVRPLGLHTAPETCDQGRINMKGLKALSDMWSFGCILCECLAWLTGGREEFIKVVREELATDERHPSGYAETSLLWALDDSGGQQIVRKSVLNWLDCLPSRWAPESIYDASFTLDWLHKAIGLVKALLNVTRDHRPTARDTESQLREIARLSRTTMPLRQPPPTSRSVELPLPIRPPSSAAGSTYTDMSVAIGATNASSHPLALKQSRPYRPASPAYSSDNFSEVPKFVQHGIHQVVHFPDVEPIIETCISADAKIAVFATRNGVCIFNIEDFANPNKNQPRGRPLMIKDQQKCLKVPFTSKPDMDFVGVRVSMPYIALLSTESHSPQMVRSATRFLITTDKLQHVELLEYIDEDDTFQAFIDFPINTDSALNIHISSTGWVAYMIDAFGVSLRRDVDSEPLSDTIYLGSESDRHTVRDFVFSDDGSHISIWFADMSDGRQFWFTWSLHNHTTPEPLYSSYKQYNLKLDHASTTGHLAEGKTLFVSMQPKIQNLAVNTDGQCWVHSEYGDHRFKNEIVPPRLPSSSFQGVYAWATHLQDHVFLLRDDGQNWRAVHEIETELFEEGSFRLKVVPNLLRFDDSMVKGHSKSCGFASFTLGQGPRYQRGGFVFSSLDGKVVSYHRHPRQSELLHGG